jgi:hypothetical protein
MPDTRRERHDRAPGWWEAIDAAISAAPAPTAELCDRVAGLIAPGLITGRSKTPA